MPRPIPVLLYHAVEDDPPASERPWAVTPATLRRHIELLADAGATGWSVAALAEHLEHGGPLPERAVVITFDDGRASQLPAAARFAAAGFPATVYVTTGFLGRGGYLSPQGVRELAAVPGIEVGAHSVGHVHLDVVSAAHMRDEIDRCRETLGELVGGEVASFAYPHGSHRRRERDYLAATGWRSGAAVKNALSHGEDDRFGFARFTVTERTTDDTLRLLVQGLGAPLAWRTERLRTRAFRPVRWAQQRLNPAAHST
jgi:peptidoglycan/xylan/chitin deacetylase (PgdA/CDA1 family)